VEWSVAVEVKFFIQSLSLNLVSFIKIDNLPFLCFAAIVAPNLNWVSFCIFSSSYIKYLVVLNKVDELIVLVFEDLEPSRVGAPDLHVLGSTSALNIP
jgi:hypothetical protein